MNNGDGTLSCLRCNRALEPIGQPGVAISVLARTVGIYPRQAAPARQVRFCHGCSVSLALGLPPQGAMNLVIYSAIRELVGSDPALVTAAFDGLHHMLQIARPIEALPA